MYITLSEKYECMLKHCFILHFSSSFVIVYRLLNLVYFTLLYTVPLIRRGREGEEEEREEEIPLLLCSYTSSGRIYFPDGKLYKCTQAQCEAQGRKPCK